MEWLHNPLITGLIGVAGLPLAMYLWNLFLPRKTVYAFGNRLGKALRLFTLEKLGDQFGSRILNTIGNTLTDLFGGISDGTSGKNNPPG